jgi:S-formylglutathione hydrolase FrmB
MPEARAALAFIRQSAKRQLRTRLFLTLVLLIAAESLSAQLHTPPRQTRSPRVQERIFRSQALDRDLHYLVILPVDYDKSEQRYPVLYLLHGWAGDYTNWVKLTNLVGYSRRYPMIVVTPDGENSWYVNSATAPGDRFEDYVVHDLVPEIDSRWRTIASPHRRAIAGLSMGGYGAVLLGLKHLGLFAVIGSVSGAFDGPAGIEQIMPDLRGSTDRAFGPAGSATRIDNNIDSLLAKASPASIPYLFLECGSQDPLLASNRKFVERLASKKVSYEYHEYPGAHTWEFWDGSLPMMLQTIAARTVVRNAPIEQHR